jgi:putative ABC transport system permease protein
MSDRLLTDLRYAMRLFVRFPAWTAVAVFSLTLGIGANLLIFSIVDAVLLRPFPYRDPAQLVFIWGTKDDSVRRGISGADLADWQQRNRSFEGIDAFLGQLTFSLGQSAESVSGACVGPSVLPLLGVRPSLGRNFSATDATPGADTVAIVSDGFWRTRMAGSPSAIGATLRLNGRTYEVVGVTPAGFFFPDTNTQILVSTPCGAANFSQRGSPYAYAIGRLREGVSVSRAAGELDAINRDLARIYPETNRNVTAGVQPFRNVVIGKYENALWLLFGAVGLVLLMACANVAHLQLARGVDRQTELAVRAANGANRWRLFRQLLTETLLLSLAAGVCALALAWWGVHVVRSLSLTDIARLDMVRIDLRLSAVAAALSLLSTLVAGVWPAWRAAGVRINDVLKVGGGGAGFSARRNLRDLLATTELALATVLLILAGLLIGSFVRLSRAQWGFDPDNLLLVTVVRPPEAAGSREVRTQWTEAARERIGRIAGVDGVASADGVPIRYSWRPTQVAIQGRRASMSAGTWMISHGYFATMRTPMLEGREFSAADDGSATPVVVVSRALARRLWSGGSAVGRELQLRRLRTVNGKLAPDIEARVRRRDLTLGSDRSDYEVETRQVIGVVEDVRPFGLHLVPDPALYLDYRQEHSAWVRGRQTRFVVRANAGVTGLAGELKSTLAAAGLNGEVRNIESMSELVAGSIGGRGSNRLMMLVAGLFGALALVLTTIGIFGMMLHTVNQRLPEMGVRVALGATRFDIARLVFGYGGRVLVAGLALGLTLTWVASRALRSLLFELKPTDLPTYAVGVSVLAVAVVLACVVPARRALSFDPARLFRS